MTGSGVIGPSGWLPSETVWIAEHLQSYQLEMDPNISDGEAKEYFWSLFHGMPSISDILLANTFAAILFPFFKAAGVESRFPIILEGPSEAKKTTVACLIGCLYNRKTASQSCVATLTSTERALEARAAEIRHGVVVFDDLLPDGGPRQKEKVLGLIRNIANQIPREARSGNTLHGVEMECGAILTAEAFPDCGQSTRTRCLRLQLSEPVPNSLLLSLQSHPERLGNVFYVFIQRLSSKFDVVMERITAGFRKYRQKRGSPNAPTIMSERLAEIGFVLHTAMVVFMEEVLGMPEENPELSAFQYRLNQWIDWQLSPWAVASYDRILSAVIMAIQTHPNEFFNKNGCICITTERLRQLVQYYCHDDCITIKDITAKLRSWDLLDMDESGKSTKKVTGPQTRHLHIKVNRLFSGF